ncbi:hypothetical protein TWF718_001825 [Orbilia javanica]|uniref:Uncharacterized protein n=1 Tax=Orbilia javanica TaxID=47235 RepID=A0AAN8N1D9_9PEZI
MSTTGSSELSGFSDSPEELQKDLGRLVDSGHEILKSLSTELQRIQDLNILGDHGSAILNKIKLSQGFELNPNSIIAFIGESGVGKSTLLNALVDYENIVPTSGLRACTSCATEFSRRPPTVQTAFTAVIEYCTLEDSKEEMEILSEDIQDETSAHGQFYADEDSDSDADATEMRPAKRARRSEIHSTDAYKIALSKLIALFPGFNENGGPTVLKRLEDLYNTSESLKAGKRVIGYDDQETFVKEVHRFISGREGNHDESQLWPLVKVVKIYLDAPVLETGAVLVDLPGLQDNNPARTSIAHRYLQKADKVIVVSRLTRILTNDTATAMARMGYAKQLELDGRKNITIVGTCCDQFELNDAKSEFGSIEEFSVTCEELEKQAKRPSKQELRRLSSDERKNRTEACESARQQLRELCDSFRDLYVPARITQEYSKLLGEDTEVKCFLVASKQYQNLDPDSDEDLFRKTQIPQLREYCSRVPLNQSTVLVKNFIHLDVLRRIHDTKVFVEDLGSLSQQIRKCICTELETAAFKMKEELDGLEVACDKRISKFRESIMEEIANLTQKSIPHCRSVLRGFYKSFHLNTYRAVCNRGGTWNNVNDGRFDKNLNRRYLDFLEDGLRELWKHCWEEVEESLSHFTASVVMLLGGFKSDWTRIIDRECPNPSPEIMESRNAFLGSLDAMSIETSKLLMEQTRRMKDIQHDIISNAISTVRVKTTLKGYYAKATKEKGKGSYDKMVGIVENGIEESKLFQDIKDSIARSLWDLAFVLNVENVDWCFQFERQLQTSITQWTATSKSVGNLEGEEKENLKRVLADLEKLKAPLISEIEMLEIVSKI